MINDQFTVERRRNWKGEVVDYDKIREYEDHECLYCLTDAQVAVLGGIIEPIGWATRWQSDTQQIDKEWVRQFRDDIQRRLMMACCPDELSPIIFQWTVEGVLQSSDDGGTTWTDAPQADPRNNSPVFPPSPGEPSESKTCIAADGMSTLIQEQVVTNLTDEMTRYTLQQLIEDWTQTLIGSGGNIFTGLITVITNQIFALVIATLRPALTAEVFSLLTCIFKDNMSEDLSFTDVQWEAVRSDILSTITGIAGIFLEHIVFLLGKVGLTNLARSQAGDPLAECDCTPGCITDNWTIKSFEGFDIGTIDVVGEDYIVVSSSFHPSFGQHVAQIQTMDDNTCCNVFSIEAETGTIEGVTFFHIVCGSPRWPTTSLGFLPGLPDADAGSNTIHLRDVASAFQARITFYTPA